MTTAEERAVTDRKTWAGEHFGSNGALARARKEFNERRQNVRSYGLTGGVGWRKYREIGDLHSGYSSALHSAAGFRIATLSGKPIFWKLLLALHALWLQVRALYHSNRAEDILGDEMTSDQWDIRQSILRSCRFWFFLVEAERCINAGLTVYEREDPEKRRAHTKALLLLGRAKLRDRQRLGVIVRKNVEVACRLLPEIELTAPKQAIRVARDCGDLILSYTFERGDQERGIDLMEQAKHLARKEGAHDQIAKIDAILRRHGLLEAA